MPEVGSRRKKIGEFIACKSCLRILAPDYCISSEASEQKSEVREKRSVNSLYLNLTSDFCHLIAR
ncbi:hypothetical protein GCM10011409_16350 [Lentibacillus populi]|uniref:Uncharacterized protein n=1 Tax=Lentibacillus populi TaxID=1827502 RepID=A0A9W5X4Z8_9BACI|nr:hypothetical protein GCM10011409_16350 [Lentibacillus populi]